MKVDSVASPAVGSPAYKVPLGACDTHTHIFGPFEPYPPSQESVYALPEATPDAHARFRSAMGLDRAILIQPAPYGTDPSAMLAAIAKSNGKLKGIAVAEDAAPLESWVRQGIVGLRFSEARTPDGRRYPGSMGFDVLEKLAPAMRALGLQAHLWAPANILADRLGDLLRLKLPIVIDHMGMPALDEFGNDAALDGILNHVRDEELWLKLTTCRLGRPDIENTDRLRAWHDRLITACPNRMLWGSDWPYVRMSPAPDAAKMLDIFVEWTNDADLVQRILVENPARLFGFKEKK